ncbi:MAG: hypothetical protein WD824_24130 [Cyclobacteriaceae bacterium]
MKRNYCILLSNLIFISSYAQLKTAEVDHYLFPEFNQGVILLKTGKKEAKLLNYNSLAGQLIFDNQGNILAVPKEQLERIDTVFIKERRFIILNNKFVELLHHSTWDLYVEYKCDLKEQGKDAGFGGTSQTSAINTPSAVRLGGNVYNLQLPDGFETKRYSSYWLKKNGELKQFINMRQLKKLYKDKNDLFNDYVKKHDVKYENQEIIIQLIEHLESN